MKLLHTSDWHVGKTVRGHSRHGEHVEVLGEIVLAAENHQADAVLVAGDLFESASPPPEAEALVYRTLLDLAGTGASVMVVAGNHDHARRLQAVAPVFGHAAGPGAGGIHVVAQVRRPEEGGVHSVELGGEKLRVACLPFVSQRGIVRAADLFDQAAYENAQAYQQRLSAVIGALCASFEADAVNVILAHAFVLGGDLGGGERSAHVIDDYAVPSQIFPPTASYVALGHVHRPQRVPGGAPIHYCGSPLHLDFGEKPMRKQVNLIECHPGAPAAVTPLPISSGRSLLTISGSVAELARRHAEGEIEAEAWLRVFVEEPSRAGLADEVRELFGDRAVEVRAQAAAHAERRPRVERRGRSPHELFAEFLAEQGIADTRIEKRFAELLDVEVAPSEASTDAQQALL